MLKNLYLLKHYHPEKKFHSFLKPFVGAFFILLFMGIHSEVVGQTSGGNGEIVLKEWEQLHQSNPDLKIYYSIMDCNTSSKILLRLTNLSQANKSVAFKLNIIDTHSGNSILREVQTMLSGLETLEGLCGENGNPDLQFPLDVNIQPKHIYLAVTF